MMVARHTHDPAADPAMDNATDNATGADAVDVEHSLLIRVHCVLMIVAFSIFGPIGIFFGSWMRPVMSQKGLWFQVKLTSAVSRHLLMTPWAVYQESVCYLFVSQDN